MLIGLIFQSLLIGSQTRHVFGDLDKRLFMAKGPQFTKFMIPLMHALREMGGSASAAEATDAVIERENVSEAELEKTLKNGHSRVRNQIAWARMYLVYSGYIDSSARGVWRLTEKGQQENLSKTKPSELFAAARIAIGNLKPEHLPAKAGAADDADEKLLESE